MIITYDEYSNRLDNIYHGKIIVKEKNFKRMKDIIIAECIIHGKFNVMAGDLVRKTESKRAKCRKCVKAKQEEIQRKKFIEKASLLHNNLYDYSKVIYVNSTTKVEIICPIHGSFFQVPHSHLNPRGCNKCNHGIKYTTEEFVQLSNKRYSNKYDYSKVIYINSNIKIEIICPIHGSFFQTPRIHMHTGGCRSCGIERTRKDPNQFIDECIEIHGKRYDYSLTKYKKREKRIIIICKIHGQFKQFPAVHLRGSGCPYCKTSKGEEKISEFLDKLEIKYESQKTFEGCIYKKPLRFDFYLLNYNICIEYDGIQHFKSFIFSVEKKNLKKFK